MPKLWIICRKIDIFVKYVTYLSRFCPRVNAPLEAFFTIGMTVVFHSKTLKNNENPKTNLWYKLNNKKNYGVKVSKYLPEIFISFLRNMALAKKIFFQNDPLGKVETH